MPLRATPSGEILPVTGAPPGEQPRAPSRRARAPRRRAAAHTGWPTNAATVAQARMAATRRSGATNGLRIRLVLLNPSLRLQIDGVQRQAEADEHADHHEQGERADEPVDAGAESEPDGDAGEQQERDRFRRGRRPRRILLLPVLGVVVASHYTCRPRACNAGSHTAPRSATGARGGGGLVRIAPPLPLAPSIGVVPHAGGRADRGARGGASGSGSAAAPCRPSRPRRRRRTRRSPARSRCCIEMARPLRQMHHE